MNHSIRIVGPVLCAVLLSACGGGDIWDAGSSGGAGSASSSKTSMLSQMNNFGAIGRNAWYITPVSTMPETGTATYKGAAVYSTTDDLVDVIEEKGSYFTVAEIRENIQVTSDATLTANFAAGSISGSLTNFHDKNGAVAGAINITNGTIAENGWEGELSGDLALSGKSSPVTGDIGGMFNGYGAKGIGGNMSGSAGDTPLSGLVLAEKQ